jgi:hypothetical protein
MTSEEVQVRRLETLSGDRCASELHFRIIALGSNCESYEYEGKKHGLGIKNEVQMQRIPSTHFIPFRDSI